MKLEDAIESARQQPLAWTHERAARVQGGAQRKRAARAARERLVWRGLAVSSVAGIVLALGRLGTHAPEAAAAEAPPAAEPAPEVALLGSGDAGYERD